MAYLYGLALKIRIAFRRPEVKKIAKNRMDSDRFLQFRGPKEKGPDFFCQNGCKSFEKKVEYRSELITRKRIFKEVFFHGSESCN